MSPSGDGGALIPGTVLLRSTLLCGLCLALLVPFVVVEGGGVPGLYFPYVTGKNFAFRLLAELLSGLYVILALRLPAWRPAASPLLWTLLAFTVWMGIATVFSVDPVKSFWSSFERMEGYISVLHLFAWFLVAGAVLAGERWWERFFLLSVAAAVCQALYAVGQQLRIGGLVSSFAPYIDPAYLRVDGTLGNAAYLATYMLINIFLVLFLLTRSRSTSHRVLCGLALLPLVDALDLTGTRGTLLALLAGGLTTAAVWTGLAVPEWPWRKWHRAFLPGLGALALLLILFSVFRLSVYLPESLTLTRLASLLSDPAARIRPALWGMAFEGAGERPFAGWGQENFVFLFNRYYEPWMNDPAAWVDRAHNQFLDWLVAGGIPAFALYTALFFVAMWTILRADSLGKGARAVLVGLFAAYAFNNLVTFADLTSSLYFMTLLAFAHGLSSRTSPFRLARPAGSRTVALATPFVLALGAGVAWSLNAPGIVRAHDLLAATNPGENTGSRLRQFKAALDRKVWPGTGIGEQETVEQLLGFASELAAASVPPVQEEVREEARVLAGQAGQRLLAARPHDAHVELLMGEFHGSYRDYAQAFSDFDLALKDSPGRLQVRLAIGVTHLNAGDLKGALAIFRAVHEEAPQDREASLLYAVALIHNGTRGEADALLLQAFGTNLIDDQRLLQAYVNTKQHDRVILMWKARVSAAPNDAKRHLGLAFAYSAAGDKAGATAEFLRAAQIDPAFAPRTMP